jgi:hypothetical protein
MLPIKYLTIHCAATPEGRDNSAAEVTKWDIDRFGQPSYHHVVELDGDAYARFAMINAARTPADTILAISGFATLAEPKA